MVVQDWGHFTLHHDYAREGYPAEVELQVYDYYILEISFTMMRVTWFMFAIYSRMGWGYNQLVSDSEVQWLMGA